MSTSEAHPPESLSRFRLAKGLLCGCVFLLVWAASAALIGWFLPFPEVSDVSAKRSYFEKHRGEIDAIFIGSSRIASQVMPKVFDAEAAKAGAPVHSFNLAVPGMFPPESCCFLREILKFPSPRLKWVFIDLMDVNSHVDDNASSTKRAEYWHDSRYTVMAWRDVLESGWNPREKARLLWKHDWLFVRHLAAAGRGVELLDAWLKITRPERPSDWIASGGFEPTPKSSLSPADAEQFIKATNTLKQGVEDKPVRKVFYEAIQEMDAEVRKIGAQPVFILTPSINGKEKFAGLPPGVVEFAFNDPFRYPILFDPALHYDLWHLNENGSEPYSRILADRFAEWVKEKMTKPE